jgi:hypothetical protein
MNFKLHVSGTEVSLIVFNGSNPPGPQDPRFQIDHELAPHSGYRWTLYRHADPPAKPPERIASCDDLLGIMRLAAVIASDEAIQQASLSWPRVR